MQSSNKDVKEKTRATAVLVNVYGYFLKSAWKKYKGYFFARTGLLIGSVTQPFISIIFLPLIIEELLGDKDAKTLLTYAAIIVVAEFVIAILNGTARSLVERYTMKFDHYYTTVLSERILKMDFQLTENKEALDQLELARNGVGGYSGGLDGLVEQLFGLVSAVITLIGVMIIIVTKAPMVLLITVGILIVTGIINNRLNKIEREAYNELSKINRVFNYIAWNLTDFRYGKDIRLYGAKDMVMERWDRLTEETNDNRERAADRQLPYRILGVATTIVRDFFTYLYLGILAILGKISIATTAQMINAAGTFSNTLIRMVTCYQEMLKRANYANEFVKFLDFPFEMRGGTRPVKEGAHVFEFRELSFSYPGSEVKVLDGINLTLHAGEHLSIVGLNGAGKTTLVKLLCRLYDPTSGEIYMDGVNIKEYDYDAYRRVFAPVFQDFSLFAFPVVENLVQKEEIRETEERAAIETLKEVGIYDRFAGLANGVHTELFRYFDPEGIEPSGGEQQKLAIARALYKNAPVIILDEPTAALDPVAEYEIYCNFHEMVEGKTAIYISHRLSSCQFCDRIAVFDEGKIRELGTHAELVKKKDGRYAEMFAAQAQYYVQIGT